MIDKQWPLGKPRTAAQCASRSDYKRGDPLGQDHAGVVFTDEQYDAMVAHDRRFEAKPITDDELYGVEAMQEVRAFHERTFRDDG